MPRGKTKNAKHLSLQRKSDIQSSYRQYHGRGATSFTARAFHVSRETVRKVIGQNLSVPKAVNRPGPSPRLCETEQNDFARHLKALGPIYEDQLPIIAKGRYGVDLSIRTLVRYLKAHNIRRYATARGPGFAADSKPLRMVAAEELLKCYESALFIDETSIGKYRCQPPGYYGEGPGLFYYPLITSSIRCNAVGAITMGGTLPLQFPDDHITGSIFARVLQTILLDFRKRFSFKTAIVMDNLSSHWTEEVQQILKDMNIGVIKIPAYCPDLNVIEHAWAYLKRKIEVEEMSQHFVLQNELEAACQTIWEGLDLTKIFLHYADTLRKIIDSHGEYTGG